MVEAEALLDSRRSRSQVCVPIPRRMEEVGVEVMALEAGKGSGFEERRLRHRCPFPERLRNHLPVEERLHLLRCLIPAQGR